MLLFDRFFATKMCIPSSDLVLLTSIATLHIAIKIRESAIIKLSTLSWFGRGRFSESRIAAQEFLVLMNCEWLVNPPTAVAFVMHILLLLPDNLNLDFKREILDASRFMAELSVADSFFISKRSSVIGLAAISISLDQCRIKLPLIESNNYLKGVASAIGVSHNDAEILAAKRRLHLLSLANVD